MLFSGSSGDWAGNHVAIRHADGKTTMSSHMSSMAVRSGQTVQAGQVIGYVGQTGRAFGAHLHFELYPVGVKYGDVYKAINPSPGSRRTASRPASSFPKLLEIFVTRGIPLVAVVVYIFVSPLHIRYGRTTSPPVERSITGLHQLAITKMPCRSGLTLLS